MAIISFFIFFRGRKYEVSYDSSTKIEDFILDITLKYIGHSTVDFSKCIVKFGEELLNNKENLNKSLDDMDIEDDDCITLIETQDICAGGGSWYDKEINIKFIKLSNNYINKNDNPEIVGLLKLCLLKEVSQKISHKDLKKLPELIYCIMEILSNGYITEYNIKENIKKVLLKNKGSSIINFSNYVDDIIDNNKINQILNLLSINDLKEMKDIRYRLSKYDKYIKFFNKEFEKNKKESFLEFSIISLVVIEREDLEKFEVEREKCQNRIEKILYHGTSVEPISSILTNYYRKSSGAGKSINGKGVYFTDSLDYGWFYGGIDGNRANFSGIPKVDDTFTVIINYIYYDRNGFKQVKDSSRTPAKNQINFAYAGARSERINQPNKNKFFATEYVINDLDQICPFMSATLKREEFCIIWRDNNFSSKPVYNNKFDQIFKSFLKERMAYINQVAKYNIYPCDTTEEALELVNRKKYNKIILISNVGTDMGGKKFIDKAREIIGNNVIVLFLAYRNDHLNWIKNYKNALFSNEPKFYEEYLQCFDEKDIKYNIRLLIGKLEACYNVKFNFDNNYLDYPYFKNDGKYTELIF